LLRDAILDESSQQENWAAGCENVATSDKPVAERKRNYRNENHTGQAPTLDCSKTKERLTKAGVDSMR
jgi:hypothetical protein